MWRCDRCKRKFNYKTVPSKLHWWSDFHVAGIVPPDAKAELCPECGIDLMNFLRNETTDKWRE